MKSSQINILLIFLCVILNNVISQNSNSGDSKYECRVEHSGIGGTCQRLSRCHSAQMEFYTAKIKPTLCYYIKSYPIVCCLDEPTPPEGTRPHKHQQQRPYSVKPDDFYNPDEVYYGNYDNIN